MKDVYVQPAAGDAGLAVGAAFFVEHQILGQPRKFVMEHAYWGPGYSGEQMRSALDRSGLRRSEISQSEPPTKSEVAQKTASSFPRAKLSAGIRAARNGGRARSAIAASWWIRAAPEMKEILNSRIKHREMFRPFAPSILEEATAEFLHVQQAFAVYDLCLFRAPGKAPDAFQHPRTWMAPDACKP